MRLEDLPPLRESLAAHGLMAEAAGAFNRTVLSFIAQVDRADTNDDVVDLTVLDPLDVDERAHRG